MKYFFLFGLIVFLWNTGYEAYKNELNWEIYWAVLAILMGVGSIAAHLKEVIIANKPKEFSIFKKMG